MRLTDAQIREMIVSLPVGSELRGRWIAELAERTRWLLIRRMPSPTGVCPAGWADRLRPVSPARARMRALLAELREGA